MSLLRPHVRPTRGLPELTGASADDARTMVARNLPDIATEFWQSHRRANEQRRARAIADFDNRLRWKAWEESR